MTVSNRTGVRALWLNRYLVVSGIAVALLVGHRLLWRRLAHWHRLTCRCFCVEFPLKIALERGLSDYAETPTPFWDRCARWNCRQILS